MAEIDAISPPDVYVLGRDTNAPDTQALKTTRQ